MILIKEHNGLLYVANITATQSSKEPGTLDTWLPIGPGLSPVLTWEGDRCFIAFDYLGHAYVRRLDTTVWPPQVVDPVTYTPYISIQEPHDALSHQVRSRPGLALIMDETLPGVGKLRRTSTMRFDVATNKFTTSVTRDTSTNPIPITRKKWRAWIRSIGASAWTLLLDWVPELPDIPLETIGAMKLQLAITYGHLWAPDYRNTEPNVSGGYHESAMGYIMTIDSDLEALTWSTPPEEALANLQGVSPGQVLDPRILFNVATGDDTLDINLGTGLVHAGMELPHSQAFQSQAYLDSLGATAHMASGAALLYS